MSCAPFAFVYAEESRLAGPDNLAKMVADLGFGGIAVALAYHRARRVFPRYGRVSNAEQGHLTFAPRRSRYRALVPSRGVDIATTRAVYALRDACEIQGLAFHAWLVPFHHEGLVAALPEAAAQTIDGSARAYALCPSHPEASAYAAALVTDVCAQLRPASVLVEAARFPGWEPAYTLTLALDPLTHRARRYGAECFCASCRVAIASGGDDPDELRVAALHAAGPPWTPAGDGYGAQRQQSALARLDAMRTRVVGELVTALACRARTTGAELWLTASGRAADIGAQGLRASALTNADGVLLGLGERSGAALASRLRALRGVVGSAPFMVTLNWAPRRTSDALAADVHAMMLAGARGIAIYNLSLVPNSGMRTIRAAARAASAPR